MTGFTLAYAVMRGCGGLPRKNPDAPLKTMIGVLRLDMGKENREQNKFILWKIFAVCLLAMVAQIGLADENYYFASWAGEGNPVITYGVHYPYSGVNVNYLTNITNNSGTHNLFNNNGDNRFACRNESDRGWIMSNQGLHCTGYAPELYICNLWNGDRVRVHYSNDDNKTHDILFATDYSAKVGSSFVRADDVVGNGTEFTAVRNGDIVIKGTSGHTYITQIDIIWQSGTPAVSFSNYSFSKQTVGGNFPEPTLSVTPSTATAYYSSNNPSVATVDERTGDVTLVGAGAVTITATLEVGGTTVADSYSFIVGSNNSTTKTYSFLGINNDGNYDITSSNREMGCEHDWDPFTLDEVGGCYLLKFNNNQTYGDCNFTHEDNRFVVHQYGWIINKNGLGNTSNSNLDLYILNLKNGERVTINLKNNASGTITSGNTKTYELVNGSWTLKSPTNNELVSGKEYIMQGDGSLKLTIPSNAHVESVDIEHENASPSLSFSKETDTYDLVTLNYIEPTAAVIPSGAKIVYSSSNDKIAKIGSADGDLMIINTGIVTISGKLIIDGIEVASDSYTLTVKAEEAVWDIRNGNELYFPTQNTNPDAMANNGNNNNTGKLLVRRVTSVPHIIMEFGNAENTNLTMVNFHNGTRSANLIDENGWQHVWLQNQSDFTMKPYQGTFYTFKPTISGKLTIMGVRSHTGSGANTVVLVDKDKTGATNWDDDVDVQSGAIKRRTRVTQNGVKYYSFYIEKYLTFGTDAYTVTEEQIDLVGGHTYYLYANTPSTNNDDGASSDWQTFYLSGFKFETSFKFPYQNVIMGETGTTTLSSETYYRVPFSTTFEGLSAGTGDITYSIKYEGKGNIKATIDSRTGALSGISAADDNKPMGGAIVVTATLTERSTSSSTSYVLTVPYTNISDGGTNTWKFNVKDYGTSAPTNMMEQVEDLKANAPASDWAIEYKVRRYDSGETKALNYINVPVLANALDVRGDNARYISSTAGLIINADVKTFGTTTSVKDDEYKVDNLGDGVGRVFKKVDSEWVEQTTSEGIDEALKALLNYDATDAVNPCNYLTLENGSSFTIPNLHEGQHIRIKWSRYSPNHGDLISVTNLNDLNGTSITDAFTIGAGGNVNLNGGTGCHEFIVAANGDVTFTVSQDGWVNIYQIDVDDPFIETELTLKTTSTWEEVENPNGTTEWKERGWADAPLTYIRKATGGDAITEKYTENFGGTLSQSNSAITYSIEGTPSGSLNGHCSIGNYTEHGITFTNGELDITSGGHGRFTLVQEGKVDGKYVLDRKKYTIKVYEYDYTTQTYPHTWNMKHVTTQTGNATVSNLTTDAGLTNNTTSHQYKHWTASNDNKDFTLNVGNPENLMAWNYKTTIGGAETVIPELDGLGIIPQDLTDGTDNSITFKAGTRGTEPNLEYGAGLQLGDKNNTIVVPSVASGQTVYVAATGSGTVTISGAGSALSPTRVLSSGVKVYEIAGSGSDVNLVFNNMTVNQIAVSKDTKTVTAAGYATEARDYPLDFTLAGTFLGTDQYAYKITGVENNMVIATRADYVPMGDGVMISGRGGYTTDWPLFTTDVDRRTSDMSSNKLVGVVTVPNENVEQSTVISGTTYYNYMLANGGYNVTMENGTPKVGTTVSGLGYYLVFATGTILSDGTSTYAGGKPAAHSAYLRLPSVLAVHQGLNSGGSARSVFFIDFDDEQTGIQKPMDGLSEKDNNVYYTIQGVRVDKPGKGLYIHNGRKVYVK